MGVLRCIYTIALYGYYPITLHQFYLIVERGLVPPVWKCSPTPRCR